jgi:hypothetical protein
VAKAILISDRPWLTVSSKYQNNFQRLSTTDALIAGGTPSESPISLKSAIGKT